MKRLFTPILIASLFASLSACKKDTLHWGKIVHLESHTSARLNNIKFVNGIGVIAGGEKYLSAEILTSADGGNTWTHTTNPDAGKGMYGLGTSPSNKIYLSGFDGKVISTGTSFTAWAVHQVPDWRYYVALTFPTDETGILVATAAQENGTIVRVNNNFQIIDTTSYGFGLNDVAFTSASTGYIAAYGVVLKTTDTGRTWQLLNVKHDNFKSVYCIDADNIWVCGAEGSIYHSADAGNTWKRSRNGGLLTQEKYRLNDIVFKDNANGWAVGEKGLVIATRDGGKTWNKYNPITESAFLSVAMAPDGNLVVTGEKGALYKLFL